MSSFTLVQSSKLRTLTTFLKPKCVWPNPQHSTGTWYRKMGKLNCWEARGPARDTFAQLAEEIKDYLNRCSDPVTHTVTWSIYMIGKTRETASPTILFCCREPSSRKAVRKTISESGILSKYPGIATGDCNRPPDFDQLVQLTGKESSTYNPSDTVARQEIVILWTPSSTILGSQIYIKNDDDDTSSLRRATAGGVFQLGDRYFVLTVAHAFMDPHEPSDQSGQTDSDFEFDIDGMNDCDDDDAASEFEQLHCSGSDITSTSVNLPLNVSTSPPGHLPLSTARKSATISYTTDPEQPGAPFSVLGNIAVSSLNGINPGLDYALVEIKQQHIRPYNKITLTGAPETTYLYPERIAGPKPVGTKIVAATASRGHLNGVLLGTPSFLRLPCSQKFQEVWTVRLAGQLSKGDCGSWVVDAENGDIYGHIVAGSPESGVAYIVPAYHIYEDLKKSFSSDLKLLMDNGDLDIVATLLTNLADMSTISAQIPRAMKLRPPLLRRQMLDLLIEKLSPPTGRGFEQLHIALVDAIDETPVDVKLLGLLLGKGRADVNYKEGKALRKAIKHTDISVVEYMFRPPDGFQPTTLRFETMRKALSTVIDLHPSHTQKLPKLNTVIRMGLPESTLSEALIWEIERHSVKADPGSWPSADVLRVLLDAGADVNTQSGKLVMLATEAAALPILKILLKEQPTSDVVDAALSRSIRLTKLDDQLSCSRALLEMGVTDQAINRALIEVSSRGDAGRPVTQQLLNFGGWPGYGNAASIKAATQARGSSTLRLLLEATKNARHQDSVAQIRIGINSSLILGAFSSDFDICRLLLKYGASVDYGGSEAIKKVTQSGNSKLLQLLLSAKPSSDTLGICFGVIRDLNQDQRYPILELLLQAGMTGPSVDSYLADLLKSSEVSAALVSLLVKFKASVHHENDRSMRSATLIQPYEIFSIICQAATKRSSFAYCFAEGMQSKIWRSHVGLQKLSLLLDKGACGEPVDKALVTAVAAYGKESNSIPFVDLLLHHNADVDYNRGSALTLACRSGDISLISKLLEKGPSGYVKFLSLLELLNSPNLLLQPEEATVNAIHAVMQSPGERPDLNPNQADPEPILKQSLVRRPEGAKILNTLIEYGAAIEGLPSLSDGDVNCVESSSLLFWALSNSDVEISTDCLVDAESFLTGKTPLILAAERGRHDVLRKLVQSGADVSARDDTNRFPLFYASQRGDSDSVRLLMDSGAAVNDGCLHEAARQLRLDAVKVLLDTGHDPNFPSPIEEHEGRGALGELLLKGRATEKNEHQIRETIVALINGGADVTVKESGKPLIYLAIDNEEPNLMVKSFIVAHLWKNKGIDQDYNLVTIGNYRYSPVTYVEKNQQLRPLSDREGLIRILRRRADRRVYYAITGPQPAHATGMPEYLQREFERQRLAEQRKHEQEHEHQRILRHAREQEAQAQQINKQRHRLQMAQDSERTQNQRDEALASARLAMDLDDEAAQRRRAAAEYDRSAELTHRRNLADQDNAALERRNQLAIEHAQNLALTEQRSLEAKAQVTSRMLSERNSFQQQQHNRTLDAAKAITAAAQASRTSIGYVKGFIESGELG